MRGRPTLERVLARLDGEIKRLHDITGGLPKSIEVDSVWKNIWLEETHHSTALEGNTLTPREVYLLVEQGAVYGRKELLHYLEVKGYAGAARWVYEEGSRMFKNNKFELSLSHIRHVHTLLMRPAWDISPPVSGESAGEFRHTTISIAGSALKPPAAGEVPALMDGWVDLVNKGPKDHPVVWAAEAHAEFEAVHPFADGNGRTGRLLMNLMLIAHGYPPAIIMKVQRNKYLGALQKAITKQDTRTLAELVARAVSQNTNKLLLPYFSEEADLIPLAELAEVTGYEHSYLRRLAQEGKLKAVKGEGGWLSSQAWFNDYMHYRKPSGRRKS